MEPILLTIDDGVAELRFNRPERLNALDLATTQAFLAAADRIVADRSARVVVLSGEGRAFVAGGDLAYLRSAPDRAAAARELISPIHEGLKRLREAGLLILAAVQGTAAGAGMSLALLSDFTLAAEGATFSMAYIRVAASPDCGGAWALTRLVGARRALEVALLGETISAQAALQMGLISRVVPGAQLATEARALAARLARLPAGAAARTRDLIDGAFSHTLAHHLDREKDAFVACVSDDDFNEALEAFFARREPAFARERRP